MKVSEEIKKINLNEEFRVCPQCSYELGFHSSFLRSEKGYRIILICPDSGRGTMWNGGGKVAGVGKGPQKRFFAASFLTSKAIR